MKVFVTNSFGLSVIIDATKESGKIFQRMNSYAILYVDGPFGNKIF